MTITELCNCSSDYLDKLGMAELEEHFRPFWATTRPVRKVEVASSGMVDKGMLSGMGGKTFSSKKPVANKTAELASKLSPEKLAWLKSQGIL